LVVEARKDIMREAQGKRRRNEPYLVENLPRGGEKRFLRARMVI
jgi:hypothetical protein